MRTISYKTRYEDIITRIPGLFAYSERNEDGQTVVHIATDSPMGCYGKVVENIKLPSNISVSLNGSTILTGGNTYNFKSLMRTYYQYEKYQKDDSNEISDDDGNVISGFKDFKKFIDKGIGRVEVDIEKTDEADLVPDYIYLIEVQKLYNQMQDLKTVCDFYKLHKEKRIEIDNETEITMCCKCQEYRRRGGDEMFNYLFNKLTEREKVASEYRGYADESDCFKITYNVNLYCSERDLGILDTVEETNGKITINYGSCDSVTINGVTYTDTEIELEPGTYGYSFNLNCEYGCECSSGTLTVTDNENITLNGVCTCKEKPEETKGTIRVTYNNCDDVTINGVKYTNTIIEIEKGTYNYVFGKNNCDCGVDTNNGTITVNGGQTVVITGNCNCKECEEEPEIPETYHIRVEKKPSEYNVSVYIDDNTTQEKHLIQGNIYELYALDNGIYVFDHWELNGSFFSNNKILVHTQTDIPTADITYVAVYSAIETPPEPECIDVTIQVCDNGGTITVSPNDNDWWTNKDDDKWKGCVPVGSNIVITATPSDGYEFTRWEDLTNGGYLNTTEKNNIENNVFTVTVDDRKESLTLCAKFEEVVVEEKKYWVALKILPQESDCTAMISYVNGLNNNHTRVVQFDNMDEKKECYLEFSETYDGGRERKVVLSVHKWPEGATNREPSEYDIIDKWYVGESLETPENELVEITDEIKPWIIKNGEYIYDYNFLLFEAGYDTYANKAYFVKTKRPDSSNSVNISINKLNSINRSISVYSESTEEEQYLLKYQTNSKLKSLRKRVKYYNAVDDIEEPEMLKDWLYYYRVGYITNISVLNDSLGNILRESGEIIPTVGKPVGDLFAYGDVIESIELSENTKKYYNGTLTAEDILNISDEPTFDEMINAIKIVYWTDVHLTAVCGDVVEDDDGNSIVYYEQFEPEEDFWYKTVENDGKENYHGIRYEEIYTFDEDSEIVTDLIANDLFDKYVKGDLDVDAEIAATELRLFEKYEFSVYNNVRVREKQLDIKSVQFNDIIADATTKIIPYDEKKGLGNAKELVITTKEGDIVIEPNYLVRREFYEGVSYSPTEKMDVYIDRGVSSVFDKHIRFGEIKTMEDMEEFTNGSYFNLQE